MSIRRMLMAQGQTTDIQGGLPLYAYGKKDSCLSNYRVYGNSETTDVEVMGVGERTINIWDEQWEAGGIDQTTGLNLNDTRRIRSKNYIEVEPNTTYFCSIKGQGYIYPRCYNKDKEYLGQPQVGLEVRNSTFVTLANTKYIRWQTYNYGVIYNNDICINVSGPLFNGQYEPYGYKVPITNEHRTKNLWDEEWEVGSLNVNNGSPTTSLTQIRSKNFCECNVENIFTCCYGKVEATWVCIFFYNDKKEFISRGYNNNRSVNVPSGTKYFKIMTNSGGTVYGTTYKNDICINESDPSFDGQYVPYIQTDTYPVYLDKPLMKIGDFEDYIDYKKGVVVRKNGCITDFSSIDISRGTSMGIARYMMNIEGMKKPSSYADRLLVFETAYFKKSYAPTTGVDEDMTMTGYNNGNELYFIIHSCQSVEEVKDYLYGKPLYYILESPVEEPITLPTIYHFKGGNAFDVPTIIKPQKMLVSGKNIKPYIIES